MGHENSRKAKSLRIRLCTFSVHPPFSFRKHFKFQNTSSTFSSASRYNLTKPSNNTSFKLKLTSKSTCWYHLVLCKNLFFSPMGGSGRWLKSLIFLRKPSPTDQVCKFFVGIFLVLLCLAVVMLTWYISVFIRKRVVTRVRESGSYGGAVQKGLGLDHPCRRGRVVVGPLWWMMGHLLLLWLLL